MQIEKIGAGQIFNPDEGYLEAAGGKMSVDLLAQNHVIDAATAIPKGEKDSLRDGILPFVRNVLQYPHIQITTRKKHLFGPGSVTPLTLDQIMFLHGIDTALALSTNQELTVRLGEETRAESLKIIENAGFSIPLIRMSREMSFPLDRSIVGDRRILVPLFNIATAVKLTDIMDVPFDESMLRANLQTPAQ